MFGPTLLVSSMTPRTGFQYGNRWQYHPRSDHHSKVACWGLLFDLMLNCSLLRKHAEAGLIAYGLNHEMRDFQSGRKKNLDLVLCRPRSGFVVGASPAPTFADEALEIGVALSPEAHDKLSGLPPLHEAEVGAVHIALEAKACMTAFLKARPRLFDELNSSHLAIHGNSPHTIAAGLAMVNIAPEFISPGNNPFSLADRPPVMNRHSQPREAALVIEKLREIPRRRKDTDEGYDAFGIVLVDCRNDGTPVTLVANSPAPEYGAVDHYEMMVHRLAQLYEQKYAAI